MEQSEEDQDEVIKVIGDVHQMHVPIFINSSYAIYKEYTSCCYLVTYIRNGDPCLFVLENRFLQFGRSEKERLDDERIISCDLHGSEETNGCKCGKKVIYFPLQG